MKKKIILIGAGPLGINTAHIIHQQGIFEIAGFIDSKAGIVGGIKVLGDDSILESLLESGITHAVVCIGDAKKRIAISATIKKMGFTIPVLVHPSADLGIDTHIGEGSIIFHNAFIGPESTVGPYCIIEAGAFIGHNTILQEGVLIAARVTVGNHTSVGSCSTLKLGAGCASKLQLGLNCTVGEFRNLFTNLADGENLAAGELAGCADQSKR